MQVINEYMGKPGKATVAQVLCWMCGLLLGAVGEGGIGRV